MPPDRQTRSCILVPVWIAAVAALTLLSSVLVAQNSPEFPQAASVRQSSISAGPVRCQTQRFDSDGLQWTAPLSNSVILPSARSANWNITEQLLPAIETKGFHFNRPPPA